MNISQNKRGILLTFASLAAITLSVIGIGNIGNAGAVTTTPCIITVSGQQYDVAPLQSSHSGGNIFNCGTDMTAIYQSAHGTNVSRLQPYLIAAPTPTPTTAPTATPTPPLTVTPTPTALPSPTTTPNPTVTPSPTGVQTPVGTVNPKHDGNDDEDDRDNDKDDNDEDEKGEVGRNNHEHRKEKKHRKEKDGLISMVSRFFRGGYKDRDRD